MNRFLDLAELAREEVLDLLALARRLQEHPEPRALAGRVLGLVFFNPSLRTLASFQAGMARLGGQSFVITPGSGTWKLETRAGAVMNADAAEHIREGIPVLASFCDALGIRAFADGRDLAADLAETTFKAMAALCAKPLVNLESAVHHPCQALADWKTLDVLGVPRGGRFVLSGGLGYIALTIEDYSGSVTTAALALEHRTVKNLGFGVGYVYSNYDVEAEAQDFLGQFAYSIGGFEIYGRVAW